MAEVALAQFVRFYDTTGDRVKWQNFFVGEVVQGHEFRDFRATSILVNRSASEGGITIEFPALEEVLSLMDQAIAYGWLVDTKVYQLSRGGSGWTLSGATVVAQFFGEVIGVQTDLSTLSVELGLGLDAITGQIPGRKMTSSLVGRLPTL
jgi:hypothetical protein